MGLGSGIRDPGPENTYPGSRIQGQKGSGSRIWIRNTEKTEEPLPVEDAECTEEDERGEEARRTPRILFIQPPDIRVRHVHAAQFRNTVTVFLNALKGTVG
jgi:hypothetical protein